MYFLTLFFDAVTKLIIVSDFVIEGCIGGFSDFRWGGGEEILGGVATVCFIGDLVTNHKGQEICFTRIVFFTPTTVHLLSETIVLVK